MAAYLDREQPGTEQVPAEDNPPAPPELLALAHAYGVDTSYDAGAGPVQVSPRTLSTVLAALGVDAGTPELAAAALERHRTEQARRLLPPAVVAWQGRRTALDLPADAEVRVELEDGGSWELTHEHSWWLPEDLPLGRHTLHVTAGQRAGRAALIVAPPRIPEPQQRSWGFLAQLYSVLSEQSWGMGDLADLAELAQWAGARLGAGFLQINPLHAGMPGTPSDPSPYRPSSRRFADPVHLRIEAIPEYTRHDEVRDLARRARLLREEVLEHDALIDRDSVRALKQQALELLHTVPRGVGREAAYRAFVRREGEWLERYAVWNALAEVHGAAWHSWPKGLRHPSNPQVAAEKAALTDRVEFHRWLAWLVDEQLRAAQRAATDAGMPIGLIHDLAVGVHPDGADAWALQDVLATGISTGAPPDAFNAHGQDWGLPPWRPDALAETGYAPFAELLGAAARHAGAIRIDHVMGLFRLWWVPVGARPTEGTYVRYDAEAMLAVLALEAHRAGTAVIGEDLGTVEPGVRERLAEHGVLGTSVLWFERDWHAGGTVLPPERWRAGCLATLTTHDLPSTAARLTGDHVALRHQLGLLARPLAEEQHAAATELADWQRELVRLGLLADGAPVTIEALYAYLRATPARLVGVWLPDTVSDPRPQNLPGTWDQYPNWRLPVADTTGTPRTLDRIAAAPGTATLAATLAPLGVPAGGHADRRTPPGDPV
ncbi:4-alpha-glucanotransferase [Kitasatospora sp. NPDC059673]|uniref:4-alpha-glucanotransferase n=1 Tax=Kitasatospora sp. NPDC059673 TaxID=3346901 RepID=UPI0036C365FA